MDGIRRVEMIHLYKTPEMACNLLSAQSGCACRRVCGTKWHRQGIRLCVLRKIEITVPTTLDC
jgi:hypothetical protein